MHMPASFKARNISTRMADIADRRGGNAQRGTAFEVLSEVCGDFHRVVHTKGGWCDNAHF